MDLEPWMPPGYIQFSRVETSGKHFSTHTELQLSEWLWRSLVSRLSFCNFESSVLEIIWNEQKGQNGTWVSLTVVVQSLSLVHLWDPMDCSTPGSSVLHYLLEFVQIHAHWVGDANYLMLCRSVLLLPSVFPCITVFSNKSAVCIRWPSIKASASATILPMNIQGWFPLGLTGLFSLQSKGLSRVFSSTTVRKHQFFSESLTDTDL